MTLIATETTIVLADPAHLAARLIAHLSGYEIALETRGGRTVADFGVGSGLLTVTDHALEVRVEAADRGELEMLRALFAAHIVECAPEPVTLRWSGLARDAGTFANFREIRLRAARNVTPHLRRLTFTGVDLTRFASAANLHVRLYFPPEGLAEPEWPRPGLDGRTLWPPDERRPAMRYYTIRHIDPAAGELDIDFVVHADAGPGSAFAETARHGAVLGMAGPVGRTAGPASWHLFAGDETALPAIARILEGLPADARGVALIEVAGPVEQIALVRPPGIEVRWLHRDDAPAGLPDRLLPAIHDAAWPEGGEPFVWVGCEFGLAKSLRRHFEKERGLPRERHLITGYWSRDPDRPRPAG